MECNLAADHRVDLPCVLDRLRRIGGQRDEIGKVAGGDTSELLFLAGIHPSRPAGRISEARYQRLALAIRPVLAKAIEAGGTTLRDFTSADGPPGYFAQQLLVYGRADEPCRSCGTPIRQHVIGQRSSFYCASCQR